MGAYVPQALKERKLWCVWKREPDPKTGKIKKPCYSASAKYNGLISKTQLWQWCSYADAEAKAEYTGEYDGIGFLFHDKGDYVLIDLDHCINDDGEPNEFAAEILQLFAGTFIEYSPSGTGLHIIVRGNIGGALFIAGKIEAYGRGGTTQYGTITGDVYDGKEPLYMQEALNELKRRYDIRPKAQQAEPVEDIPATADDVRIMELLTDYRTNDNAAQFARLYAGNFDACTNPDAERCAVCPIGRQRGRMCFRSASEADFRLIRIIKAYSKNYEQTARIFRRSGLYRPEKATDDYIRRIFDYTSTYDAPQGAQTAQNGSRGANAHAVNKTPTKANTGAYRPTRGTLTDQPTKNNIKRAFRK